MPLYILGVRFLNVSRLECSWSNGTAWSLNLHFCVMIIYEYFSMVFRWVSVVHVIKLRVCGQFTCIDSRKLYFTVALRNLPIVHCLALAYCWGVLPIDMLYYILPSFFLYMLNLISNFFFSSFLWFLNLLETPIIKLLLLLILNNLL